MAATSMYSLPLPEDTMDVSSPADPLQDDEIDIDLDYDDHDDIQADQNMVDNADVRHDNIADDIMQDDDNAQDAAAVRTALQDEDLIDYSDEEPEPDVGVVSVDIANESQAGKAGNHSAEHEEPASYYAHQKELDVEDQDQNQTLNAITAISGPPAEAPATDDYRPLDSASVRILKHDVDTGDDYNDDDGDPLLDFEPHDDLTAESDDGPVIATLDTDAPDRSVELSATQQTARRDDTLEANLGTDGSTVLQDLTEEQVQRSEADIDGTEDAPEERLDTSTDTAYLAPDAPGTPTDTGLHPVIFYYHDDAFPLFKSKTATDGLLKDDNLVSVSLADFIKACRQRLAIKTDHEIGDNLELHLTFEILNLTVIEDSPAAFQTSLKDVLDVFVLLHENDGVASEDIPTLEITCNLQVKFNNSILLLQTSAASGTGISSFTTTYQEPADIQHDDDVQDYEGADKNIDEHDKTLQEEDELKEYDDDDEEVEEDEEDVNATATATLSTADESHNTVHDEDQHNPAQVVEDSEALAEEVQYESESVEGHGEELDHADHTEEVNALDDEAETEDHYEEINHEDQNETDQQTSYNDDDHGGSIHDDVDFDATADASATKTENEQHIESGTAQDEFDFDFEDPDVPASSQSQTPTKRGREASEDEESNTAVKRRKS